MMPMGRSRCGLRHSSAAVETESNPMYVKKMMEPPVSTPDQPLGMKGCQLLGWMKPMTAKTKMRIAVSLKATIILLVEADSRMPRTRMTVRMSTMRNAGMLNPKCQPG